MPPMRSLPSPLIRPLKTERSHEENQERAYIAASRRSDRSLEARVESARRASEIHKRRTGRSLRVTEQDVINEEMYEEEDDDLPLQYRRLTAHLQTGSPDFNRRLHAYIQNQVAMRTALSQAVANQRFAASHGLNPQTAFPQMWQSMDGSVPQQQQQQQQQQYPGGMPSPSSTHAYSPSYHPYAHHRSTSFAVSNTSGPQTPVDGAKPDTRRSSEPIKSIEAGTGDSEATTANSDALGEHTKVEPKEDGGPTSNVHAFSPTSHTGVSPLTTSIPLETQTFFQHPSFNMNQLNMPPFNMNPNDTYNFNQNNEQHKQSSINPRFHGMSQTLAPSMLDTKNLGHTPMPQSFSPSGNTTDLDSAVLSSTYDTFNFDNQFNTDEYGFQGGESHENEFADLLDSSAFVDSGDEQPASQS